MEVACPCLEDRIAGHERRVQRPAVDQREEPGHAAVALTDGEEHLRRLRLPAFEQRGGRRPVVAAGDRPDHRRIARLRGLDHQRLRARREERLAHDRVVDQVEHVGGVAPELRRPGFADLGPQLAPGGAAVGPVAGGIGRPQESGHRVTDGLVHDQAVAATVHERQLEQAPHGLAAVGLTGHGGKQRGRDPPHERRGFERAPRERIVHVFEISPRELLDDAGHRRVLDLELRSLGDARGREHQRERMPAGDPVQASGVAGPDPVVLQQRRARRRPRAGRAGACGTPRARTRRPRAARGRRAAGWRPAAAPARAPAAARCP